MRGHMLGAAAIAGAVVLTAVSVHAGEMAFVDEWSCGDVSAYGQASALLTSSHPHDLTEEPDYGGVQVRYATLLLTDSTGRDVPLVVAVVGDGPETPAVYVDCDADGRLADDERAPLADGDERPPEFGKQGTPAWAVRVTRPDDHCVALRLGTTGLTVLRAVRGYARGSVVTRDGERDAIAVDADADAALEVGADLVYVDVDGSGDFDQRLERLPLLSPLQVADPAIEFASPQGMRSVSWGVAPTEKGALTLTLSGATRKPSRLFVSVSRAGGGAYVIRDLGRPVELPVGSYSVGSAFLEFADEGGPPWVFSLTRVEPGGQVRVDARAQVDLDLLPGLHVVVERPDELRAGGVAPVSVGARTDGGLEVQRGSRGDLDAASQLTPSLSISAPNGTLLVKTNLDYG